MPGKQGDLGNLNLLVFRISNLKKKNYVSGPKGINGNMGLPGLVRDII